MKLQKVTGYYCKLQYPLIILTLQKVLKINITSDINSAKQQKNIILYICNIKQLVVNAFHKFCLLSVALTFILIQSSSIPNECSHTQNKTKQANKRYTLACIKTYKSSQILHCKYNFHIVWFLA